MILDVALRSHGLCLGQMSLRSFHIKRALENLKFDEFSKGILFNFLILEISQIINLKELE